MDGLNTLEMLPGLGGAHAVIDTLYEQGCFFCVFPSFFSVTLFQDRRKIEHEEKLLHNMIGKAVAKLAVHPKCLGDLSSLSADALRLISKAYEGLAGDDCVDYHTHVLGSSNCCDTGCFSPTADGPLQASFMEILKRSAGVQVAETADSDFVSLLLKLRARGKNVILAFDAHYTEDGELDLKKTGMYVPNDYVFRLVEKHSDKVLGKKKKTHNRFLLTLFHKVSSELLRSSLSKRRLARAGKMSSIGGALDQVASKRHGNRS
jgi:hypothetical protein